jgi:hypothetical protein
VVYLGKVVHSFYATAAFILAGEEGDAPSVSWFKAKRFAVKLLANVLGQDGRICTYGLVLPEHAFY